MRISKLEQKLLLLATFTIPVCLVALNLSFIAAEIYNVLFPPQIGFAVDDWSQKPTFPIIKIAAFLNLTLSGFFIFREKIYASLLTFILPILSIIPILIFIQQRVEEILKINDAETLKYYGETSLIKLFWNSLDNANITILVVIVGLFFWQFSILLRSSTKTLINE